MLRAADSIIGAFGPCSPPDAGEHNEADNPVSGPLDAGDESVPAVPVSGPLDLDDGTATHTGLARSRRDTGGR